VKAMKLVLADDRDIKNDYSTVINAALMLPSLGRFKSDAISDYLVALIKDDKTHDVVRLSALKAMREILPITLVDDQTDLEVKSIAARKKRDIEHVEALTKFIERQVKIEGLSPEEINAVRYLRREAITSLASAGAPAVSAIKKQGKVEGAVAPTLMNVIAGNLTPTPSLQEKIEAAIGLCHMKSPKGLAVDMPEYDPQLSVYLVALTLDQFVKEYNKDFTNFSVTTPAKKIPYLGWKTEGRRFKAALSDLVKNVGKGPASELDFRVQQPILDKVLLYHQPEQIQALFQFVNDQRGKNNGKVFKTIKYPPIVLDGSGQ